MRFFSNAKWVASLAFLILSLGNSSLAKEHQLVSTSSDKDNRVETFAVEVDNSGQLSRLWQREDSKPDKSYTLEQLQKGVVLRRESGRDAIRFVALEVDPTQGGTVRMDYLYSGVPPEQYNSLTLELRKLEAEWRLFSMGDERPIKALHFVTNVTSFLGMQKIIGIRGVKIER